MFLGALTVVYTYVGLRVMAGFDCEHFNSHMGATFDLSELQRLVLMYRSALFVRVEVFSFHFSPCLAPAPHLVNPPSSQLSPHHSPLLGSPGSLDTRLKMEISRAHRTWKVTTRMPSMCAAR